MYGVVFSVCNMLGRTAVYHVFAGQFWGPMVKKEGVEYRMMDPVTYIPAEIK